MNGLRVLAARSCFSVQNVGGHAGKRNAIAQRSTPFLPARP